MFYIGIDPGQEGGIAVLAADGTVLDVHRMPATERDILDVLAPYAGLNPGRGPAARRALAVVERVSASPQMGVSSAFSFGRGYGALLMALAAARITFDQVVPRVWQPAMGVFYPGKAEHGKRDKNVAKRRAQQLFPQLTITHAIADSLLIAEYCRRLEKRSGKEESRGAQVHPEAPGEEARHVSKATGGGARESRRDAKGAAVATAAGHGARSQQKARSSVRGHRRGA